MEREKWYPRFPELNELDWRHDVWEHPSGKRIHCDKADISEWMPYILDTEEDEFTVTLAKWGRTYSVSFSHWMARTAGFDLEDMEWVPVVVVAKGIPHAEWSWERIYDLMEVHTGH